MKTRIFLLLLSCATLFACNTHTQPAKQEASIHLGNFKGLPPKLLGCSCYFSKNETDFQNELYVFASDQDRVAYININNHQIKLTRTQTTRNDTIENMHNYQETYSDGVYKVILKVHMQQNNGDEVWWNTGTITLLFKETEIETLNFLGECGC